jgi:hypothetical protein
MPIPKPRQAENESEYNKRCMSAIADEYPVSQRYAVCQATWKRTKSQFDETHNDYPDAVSNNAKRGIELNEKNGNKCATQVGKVRAQQLANKEPLSMRTIKRMSSYLSRAETYYDEGDTSSCGYISYLLWGGKAGKRWAESKIKEYGKE